MASRLAIFSAKRFILICIESCLSTAVMKPARNTTTNINKVNEIVASIVIAAFAVHLIIFFIFVSFISTFFRSPSFIFMKGCFLFVLLGAFYKKGLLKNSFCTWRETSSYFLFDHNILATKTSFPLLKHIFNHIYVSFLLHWILYNTYVLSIGLNSWLTNQYILLFSIL